MKTEQYNDSMGEDSDGGSSRGGGGGGGGGRGGDGVAKKVDALSEQVATLQATVEQLVAGLAAGGS